MLNKHYKYLLLVVMYCFSISVSAAENSEPVTVYTAAKIITMDATQPTATAIAIRGRRILAVGSLADLKPWLDVYPHTIDNRFKDKILMPGLIDPHLHPLLGAIQFGTYWITPEAWQLHDSSIEATTDPKSYMKQLKHALEASEGDGKPIFITWGWTPEKHGEITRQLLDQLEPQRPVMVWHRSTHEAVYNTAALQYLKLTKADVDGYKGVIDWQKGYFAEAGLFDVVLPKLGRYLLSPDFIASGYKRIVEYLNSGGITTIGDLATGQISWPLELNLIKRHLIDDKAPVRTVLVPSANMLAQQQGGLDSSFDFINNYMEQGSDYPQLITGKRIKLFADGAMFSQLMQIGEPGYIDGHHGQWITPKEHFLAQAKKYWDAGYRIHVHANGDEGINFTLDVFEQLQLEKPRLKNSLVLEHYGYANEYVNRRVAKLGAAVSANPFYLFALGDSYAEYGLGSDRARRITPLSGLVERQVTVALHSDFGMAPAQPLYLAWAAISRETMNGKKYTPPRGLTLDEALRSITIDAAIILGLDKDIGSLESGKLADIAILEQDPYAVSTDELKKVQVWGTLFEGNIRKRANLTKRK